MQYFLYVFCVCWGSPPLSFPSKRHMKRDSPSYSVGSSTDAAVVSERRSAAKAAAPTMGEGGAGGRPRRRQAVPAHNCGRPGAGSRRRRRGGCEGRGEMPSTLCTRQATTGAAALKISTVVKARLTSSCLLRLVAPFVSGTPGLSNDSHLNVMPLPENPVFRPRILCQFVATNLDERHTRATNRAVPLHRPRARVSGRRSGNRDDAEGRRDRFGRGRGLCSGQESVVDEDTSGRPVRYLQPPQRAVRSGHQQIEAQVRGQREREQERAREMEGERGGK